VQCSIGDGSVVRNGCCKFGLMQAESNCQVAASQMRYRDLRLASVAHAHSPSFL
jgi:hypothetical protein